MAAQPAETVLIYAYIYIVITSLHFFTLHILGGFTDATTGHLPLIWCDRKLRLDWKPSRRSCCILDDDLLGFEKPNFFRQQPDITHAKSGEHIFNYSVYSNYNSIYTAAISFIVQPVMQRMGFCNRCVVPVGKKRGPNVKAVESCRLEEVPVSGLLACHFCCHFWVQAISIWTAEFFLRSKNMRSKKIIKYLKKWDIIWYMNIYIYMIYTVCHIYMTWNSLFLGDTAKPARSLRPFSRPQRRPAWLLGGWPRQSLGETAAVQVVEFLVFDESS